MNQDYKMLDPIEEMVYTDEENLLWQTLYEKLSPLIEKHGCREFVENFNLLRKNKVFTAEKIPQLNDIQMYLREKTNFRIKPVSGILSQRQFLNFLAFRTFASTQYLRHKSVPYYTPEPDIFHEFLGHMPMFCDPTFCDIS